MGTHSTQGQQHGRKLSRIVAQIEDRWLAESAETQAYMVEAQDLNKRLKLKDCTCDTGHYMRRIYGAQAQELWQMDMNQILGTTLHGRETLPLHESQG